ncbi:hypothetical protein [Methylobacterium mesophilicum]|uniref:hypothetical protein n=1 Tax=Methylobacterium mesophilicum TaxID=39956 RepID=UPI002F357388
MRTPILNFRKDGKPFVNLLYMSKASSRAWAALKAAPKRSCAELPARAATPAASQPERCPCAARADGIHVVTSNRSAAPLAIPDSSEPLRSKARATEPSG